MKYGVHAGLWMAQWTDELKPIFRTVADLGFDGVEISMLDMTNEYAQALGKMVQEFGIEITCTEGLKPDQDFTSADPDIRQAGLEYIKRSISYTNILGSKLLCGVLYAPWGTFEIERKAERAELAAEALGSLDSILKDQDITLGLEAINRFETDMVNTSAEATSIATASGSDRVGVLLDTFHMNIEEKSIADGIAHAGEELIHFHVSDNDRGVPGTGHVPWLEVRDSLKALDYDGWIVAEMFVRSGCQAGSDLNIWRNTESDPTDAAKRALAFMKETFS